MIGSLATVILSNIKDKVTYIHVQKIKLFLPKLKKKKKITGHWSQILEHTQTSQYLQFKSYLFSDHTSSYQYRPVKN